MLKISLKKVWKLRNKRYLCTPIWKTGILRRKEFLWKTGARSWKVQKSWKSFGSFRKKRTFASPFEKRVLARGFRKFIEKTGNLYCTRSKYREILINREALILLFIGIMKCQWQAKNYIEIIQWRVWSWLRMNASGRLNTCKSRGSMTELSGSVDGDRRKGA